jgi:hypothetical protein
MCASERKPSYSAQRGSPGDSNAIALEYVDHVSRSGKALFEKACEMDLEGIVAKHKLGKYMAGREQSTWFKIRNRSYSQWDGRHELFESREDFQPPGWDVCVKAAAAGTQEA